MKNVGLLFCCVVLSGCVAILVQKEVQVRKDAKGNIIETIEIERATQQGAIEGGLQFDYLKTKKEDPSSATVYAR
jgi:hypothetical protein